MTMLLTPSSTPFGFAYAASRLARYDISPAKPRSSQTCSAVNPPGVTAGAIPASSNPSRTASDLMSAACIHPTLAGWEWRLQAAWRADVGNLVLGLARTSEQLHESHPQRV